MTKRRILIIDDELDEGNGFDNKTPPKLAGLKKLQADYQRVGGSLELSGYPNQGVSLTITLPLKNQ